MDKDHEMREREIVRLQREIENNRPIGWTKAILFYTGVFLVIALLSPRVTLLVEDSLVPSAILGLVWLVGYPLYFFRVYLHQKDRKRELNDLLDEERKAIERARQE